MATPLTTHTGRGSTSPTAGSTSSARRSTRTPTSPTTRTPSTCARTCSSIPPHCRPSDRRALQAELIRALTDGPGVVVFEGAFATDVVDRASEAFFAIIEAQRAAGSAAGDHFGKPGANDRIWNAAQKLALHAPEVFAEYYANDTLAVVSRGLAGSALPGHLAGQRRQSRWHSSRFRTATTTSASSRRRTWRPTRRTCTARRRC